MQMSLPLMLENVQKNNLEKPCKAYHARVEEKSCILEAITGLQINIIEGNGGCNKYFRMHSKLKKNHM